MCLDAYFQYAKKFEEDVILTSTYLINRLPSQTLSFDSPLHRLQKHFPNSRLSLHLPLNVFGSTAFVHVYSTCRNKLKLRVVKCVFIRYSPTQKGYKYYDPFGKRVLVNLHVTFFEKTPYFPRPLQRRTQGKIRSQIWNS